MRERERERRRRRRRRRNGGEGGGTYAKSPGCRCRSSRKVIIMFFASIRRTQDRHFLTSESEFFSANSCIFISSDTIGSMKTQKVCKGGGGRGEKEGGARGGAKGGARGDD